ncbi:MAG: glycosyltransferase family protein [Ruminiclostridium sp.]
MNKFKKILEKLLIIACLIYIGITTISNCVVFIKEKVFFYVIPVGVVICILYMIIGFIKVKVRYFAISLFILAFVLKVIISVCYNAPPISDFGNFYNAALKAAKGDFSFSTSRYFSLWAYQTGIVTYYAILIKIFGSGILALKIVNCLFIAGVNVILYLIAQKLVSEKHARFIALLYLFYPATFFLASVLTNQHVSNFFILFGVYVFISRQKIPIWGILISASLIAIGNAMRPQAIVVILAIAGSIFFQIIGNIRDKKINIKLIKSIASFLLIYMIITQGLSFGIKGIGLNDNGLKNTFPLYKFVIGLNSKTNGTYSQEDTDKLTQIRNPKIRDEKSIEIIKERLSDHKNLAILILNKQVVMWSGTDTSLEWGFGYLKDTGVNILGRNVTYKLFNDIIHKLEKTLYIFIFFMAIFGILVGYKRHKNVDVFTTFALIILINFVIYSLIEIQPRYRDFQMIFIFIIAAMGIELIEEFFIFK